MARRPFSGWDSLGGTLGELNCVLQVTPCEDLIAHRVDASFGSSQSKWGRQRAGAVPRMAGIGEKSESAETAAREELLVRSRRHKRKPPTGQRGAVAFEGFRREYMPVHSRYRAAEPPPLTAAGGLLALESLRRGISQLRCQPAAPRRFNPLDRGKDAWLLAGKLPAPGGKRLPLSYRRNGPSGISLRSRARSSSAEREIKASLAKPAGPRLRGEQERPARQRLPARSKLAIMGQIAPI